MLFQDLHVRYGSYVSQRLRAELTRSEFGRLDIHDLCRWLEARAEQAHMVYRGLLNNPLLASENMMRAGEACRRWRQAEDLSYLVAVSDDVVARPKVG